MHQPFQAMAQGKHDYTVDVFPISNHKETMLVIGAEEGAIYITKAQAMEFFGLVETPVMYVDNAGELISRVSAEQVEAVLGPAIDKLRQP